MGMDASPSLTSSPFELFPEERGLYLIRLLLNIANQISTNSLENADHGLEQLSYLASPHGDTVQRITAYFTEALGVRVVKRWSGIHQALNATKISSLSEEILVQKLYFEICPFMKLAYMTTNQAIVEAVENEKNVHVIDLHAFEPAQWINLLQSLSARPEGPPHLRITGIHEQKEVLENMAIRLQEEAKKLNILFQFNPIVSKLENLDFESLREIYVKPGEALAVSSVLQLHLLLATENDILGIGTPSSSRNPNSTPRDYHRTLGDWLKKDIPIYQSPETPSVSSPKMGNVLSALWRLSPKVMVIAEQEANHNGSTFIERVRESLNFYATLFDCLESTLSRSSIERQKVEKVLFGEEIKDIIACEGPERKERHEKLEKWILRLEMAGFCRVGLSYHGMLQAKRLLQYHFLLSRPGDPDNIHIKSCVRWILSFLPLKLLNVDRHKA
ncbi:hypothetical protein ACFE04_000913 [Oxalis oulophora]